jgi:hypothetical protein
MKNKAVFVWDTKRKQNTVQIIKVFLQTAPLSYKMKKPIPESFPEKQTERKPQT